jgi:hypothetical protein
MIARLIDEEEDEIWGREGIRLEYRMWRVYTYVCEPSDFDFECLCEVVNFRAHGVVRRT